MNDYPPSACPPRYLNFEITSLYAASDRLAAEIGLAFAEQVMFIVDPLVKHRLFITLRRLLLAVPLFHNLQIQRLI